MKKFLLLTIAMLIAVSAFSQTQKGYVKTKGRLDNDGNLIPGTPLSEVVVKVKDRNEVMSDKRGDFTFPMPDNTYYLENVTKNGYVLTDPDVLSKQYTYSTNKLVISLETREEQIEERMENFTRINAAQNEMIRKLRAEVKQLKEENKITEEEYGRRLQEIADMQMESQQLVEEMVDRYSKIDFDQMDDFDRQIKAYILNGELVKAKELVKSKGDLAERAENLKKINEANAKEREELTKRNKKLEKSEALALKERDDLANDYYNLFEIYKMEHKNDSAACYIEMRAALDTTNAEWQFDAGDYNIQYISNYNNAMVFYNRILYIPNQNNEQDNVNINAYIKLGNVYVYKNEFDKAMDYYNMALDMTKNVLGYNDAKIAQLYNNIGLVYANKSVYKKALYYYNMALDILANGCNSDNINKEQVYSNIGSVYCFMSDFDKALDYYSKILLFEKSFSNMDEYQMALIYNNLGYIYSYKNDYVKALDYYQKSLNIKEDIWGFEHPSIATTYSNIGSAYDDMGDTDKALDYYTKALNIGLSILGYNNSIVANIYNNMGYCYCSKTMYDKALEYYEEALKIKINIYGENSLYVATSYNNIGSAYDDMKLYDKALEYYYKSLEIRINIFGENNKSVARVYSNISIAFFNKEDYFKAYENIKKALDLSNAILDDNDSLAIKIRNNYGIIQQKLKESPKK